MVIVCDVGVVCVIGKGLNCWLNVYVVDVVDLYLCVVYVVLLGGFYYVENGEVLFV